MIALLPVVLAVVATPDDPARLELTDLAAYRRALEPAATGPAPRVDFATLWNHSESWQGRRVEVEGRVARVFRQPAVGSFPPLVEAWLTGPAGDPFCVVFPDRGATDAARLGATVRFAGTYLRRLRYPGGDVDRLAPWLVGPDPPTPVASPAGNPSGAPAAGRPYGTDFAVAVAITVAILAVLARRHLARPVSRPSAGCDDPPPRFLEGGGGGVGAVGSVVFEDGREPGT